MNYLPNLITSADLLQPIEAQSTSMVIVFAP